MLANHKCGESCASVQEMAVQDYCAERGEAKENEAENGVDEAEKDRADALGDEANEEDQHGEPSHQAGGGHQDSPPGGGVVQD